MLKLNIKKFINTTGFYEVLTHFKNYFSSEIALKAISFVSIPIMTRLLSPADYGVINLFMSYLGIFTVVLTLNIYVAVGRYYYENADDFKIFFGTTLFLLVSVIGISSIFFLFFSDYLTIMLDLPKGLILCFIPLIIFSVVTSIFTQVYQPLKQSRLISRVSIITALFTFIFSVVFIVSLEENKYWGSIYASLLVGTLSSIYLLYKLKTYLNFKLSYKAVKYIVSYSLPLIPYALSSLILVQFDRIMINSFHGSESVGLYSFAYNIGMLLAVFHSALNSAWIPYYYKHMAEKNYVQHDKEIGLILKLVVLAAVFLSYFGKEMGLLLSSKSFHSSLNIVPVIVLSYFFLCVYYVYSRNFEFYKNTIISSFVVLFSGVVNILLNLYAFPIYGYKAAAFTTLIAYIIMALLAWAISKFYLKAHSTPLKVVLKNTYLIIPFIAVYYLLQMFGLNLMMEIIIKISLFFILAYLTYRQIKYAPINILSRSEI